MSLITINVIIGLTLVETHLITTMGIAVRKDIIQMTDIIDKMILRVIIRMIILITEIVIIGQNMSLALNTCTEIVAIMIFPMKKKFPCQVLLQETMRLIVLLSK